VSHEPRSDVPKKHHATISFGPSGDFAAEQHPLVSSQQRNDFGPCSVQTILLNMRRLNLVAFVILAYVSSVSAYVQKSLGKRHGVKGSSLQMTILSYNGKKKDFKAGSPLSSAAAALGVKPKYSCKK